MIYQDFFYAFRLARSLLNAKRSTPERRQRLAHLKDPMVGHEPICAYPALWLGLNAHYGWRELPELT